SPRGVPAGRAVQRDVRALGHAARTGRDGHDTNRATRPAMRILQVTDGYPPEQGFAHRWCQHLSRALVARGHAVRVLRLRRSRPTVAVAWDRADVDEGVSVRRCAPSPPLHALHRLRRGAGRQAPPPWSAELRALLWKARRSEDLYHLHGSPPHAL